MTRTEFRELKIGAKIRRPNRSDVIHTVINNDLPGNLILVPRLCYQSGDPSRPPLQLGLIPIKKMVKSNQNTISFGRI